jgi:hypothetical protein
VPRGALYLHPPEILPEALFPATFHFLPSSVLTQESFSLQPDAAFLTHDNEDVFPGILCARKSGRYRSVNVKTHDQPLTPAATIVPLLCFGITPTLLGCRRIVHALSSGGCVCCRLFLLRLAGSLLPCRFALCLLRGLPTSQCVSLTSSLYGFLLRSPRRFALRFGWILRHTRSAVGACVAAGTVERRAIRATHEQRGATGSLRFGHVERLAAVFAHVKHLPGSSLGLVGNDPTTSVLDCQVRIGYGVP